uniref:Reverse transcriptase zinc-binding domain-containing protein n=1 Tax=Cannabis sativa TaxID=3483 RepID=A0A803QG45_CANSA
MKQGLIWKVGNGTIIRTIEDHWLPNCRIKSYFSLPPSESTLSFFLSPSGAWDPNKFRQFFDDQLVDSILNVPISALVSRDIPSSSSFNQRKQFWSKIWSSSVPPKIKHLVWRVLSSSIPVASLLFFRHIIPSPICPICHLKWETVEHAILDCADLVVSRCDEQVYSPPHRCWKVNTDAGVSNTAKKHSLRVVVRDECDNIKVGLIVPIIGSVPPEVAEAKAILTAIYWLQATKLPVAVLQSECKSVVDKIYAY